MVQCNTANLTLTVKHLNKQLKLENNFLITFENIYRELNTDVNLVCVFLVKKL